MKYRCSKCGRTKNVEYPDGSEPEQALWMYCGTCHRMISWRREDHGDTTTTDH